MQTQSIWAQCIRVALALLLLAGCSHVAQVQYFEVVGDPDPDTGLASKSYYRMVIESNGFLVSKYDLKASYVSAATVDTLNGKIPTIPEADMAPENEKSFKEMKQTFFNALKDYATRHSIEPAETPYQQDQRVSEIARQAWYSSLTDADIISLGQEQNTNPFRFRKLIFYTSATSVSLEDYDKQINSALEKTGTLARFFKDKSTGDSKEEADHLRSSAQKLLATFVGEAQARKILANVLKDTKLQDATKASLISELPKQTADEIQALLFPTSQPTTQPATQPAGGTDHAH